MKDVIFISHANPEDNYFAGWLASKLRLLGYKVWVDIKNLRAGSSFWNEIELIMRNDSIRFISIVSEPYISKSRNSKTGVYTEVALAKILSKKIDNYIIPLRLDESSYDDFPLNTITLDTIDFNKNWGKGLKELISLLEEQEIPKYTTERNVLSEWHEYHRIEGKVVDKKEFYGSNWFKISIPKFIYVYRFRGDFKKIVKQIPFDIIRNGDYIISFYSENNMLFEYDYFEKILTDDILINDSITLIIGDELKDIQQKLTSLLNKSISTYFYGLDNFGAAKGSGKKKIFYPKFGCVKGGYVSLKHFKKRGRKIFSKYKGVQWRFGLSFIFQLKPFPHLVANYHLVCSDNEGLLNKDKQVKARRSIPSEWFNRDWYERILAFLHLASDMSKELKLIIPLENDSIIVSLRPVTFVAKKSYNEKE